MWNRSSSGAAAPDETDKTGGVDADLRAGLAMLVFGIAWSRLRPAVVDRGPDVAGEHGEGG